MTRTIVHRRVLTEPPRTKRFKWQGKSVLFTLVDIYPVETLRGKYLFDRLRYEYHGKLGDDKRITYGWRDNRGEYHLNKPCRKPRKAWHTAAPFDADDYLVGLPDLDQAISRNKPVYWVEGEKDRKTMALRGYYAVTHHQGINALRVPFTEEQVRDLAGAERIVICIDDDDPGWWLAYQKREALIKVGVQRKNVSFWCSQTQKDVTDDVEDYQEQTGDLFWRIEDEGWHPTPKAVCHKAREWERAHKGRINRDWRYNSGDE